MAKHNPKQKPVSIKQQSAAPTVTETISTGPKFPSWLPYVIIFAFSFAIYSNTLWNRYAIDDTIVVTDNKYTKKGFGGLKEHFTHDMFEGFFGERGAKLVSGGRYRPLSMASLAVEYEIVRKARGDKRDVIDEKNIIMTEADPYLSPFLSHFINILLFAATGLILFYLLNQLFQKGKNTPFYASLAFIITMLYAAHPIHTEAVANIKGRDEVMCMMFSLLSLVFAVKYVKTQNIVHLIIGAVIYFIALLSKENAITFLAVIPLVYYFFTKAETKNYLLSVGLYLLPAAIFLILRSQYTQAGLTQDSPEILNNPFVGHGDFSERYGTTVYTFLRYYWMMLVPHPLTHDYYFNQVPYYKLSDGMAIIALLSTIGLVAYALFTLSKKSIVSFGILFFFITFSVASNVLFTVGVLMNERFIYMSSLGFCVILAYAMVHYVKSQKALLAVLVVILSLYSVRTYTRNYDWKDSFTLFRRDAVHSPNSAKIQTSLGGDLSKAALSNIALFRDSGMIETILKDLGTPADQIAIIEAQQDTILRKTLLDSSIAHLTAAVNIYPTHSNAWLMLGNAYYQRNHNPQEVIPIYSKAAAYRVGGYYDAYFNLGIVYNDLNRLDSARNNLLLAYASKPEQVEVRYMLAQVYAKLNQEDSMLLWLQRGSELRKLESYDYYLMGMGFGRVANNLPKSIEYLQKAIAMDPNAVTYYEDLGVAYGLSGRIDDAIAVTEKILTIDDKYPPAYLNLALSYRNKGNAQKYAEYLTKYNELTGKNLKLQ